MMDFSITHHVWSRAVVSISETCGTVQEVVAFFNASVFILHVLLVLLVCCVHVVLYDRLYVTVPLLPKYMTIIVTSPNYSLSYPV